MRACALKYGLPLLIFEIIDAVYEVAFRVEFIKAELIPDVTCQRQKNGNANRKADSINEGE
jgi:hypothetical protein